MPKKEKGELPSKESILKNHLEIRFNDETGDSGDGDDQFKKMHSSQISDISDKNKDCIIF